MRACLRVENLERYRLIDSGPFLQLDSIASASSLIIHRRLIQYSTLRIQILRLTTEFNLRSKDVGCIRLKSEKGQSLVS